MRKSFESAMHTVAPAILLLITAFGACSSAGMKASGKEAGAGGAGEAGDASSPAGLAGAGGTTDAADSDEDATADAAITPPADSGTLAVFAGAISGIGTADGTGDRARFYDPSGVAVDGAGNVFVADHMSHTIRKITPAGVVTTFAGRAGAPGYADGPGADARFSYPSDVAADRAGNVYVADYSNDIIRKITPVGLVATLAGRIRGSADGAGAAASFTGPTGVTVDAAGNVFVADYGNRTVRMITPAGVVTTVAGSPGASGSQDGTGAAARFNSPSSVTVDAAGNLFVAESAGHTIRRITPAGVVTTLAGSPGASGSQDGGGADARFNQPAGVAVDGAGSVFVAEFANHTIRKITPGGVVTTLAGSAGSIGSENGLGAVARFYHPNGLATDAAGHVLVADSYNHTVRKITPAGVVTTFAGGGEAPGSEDGSGTVARFNYPQMLAVDGAGNLFVADGVNHTIRKITSAGVVTTLAGSPGSRGSADGAGTDARFNSPEGVAVDGAGNVFVADFGNHTIRKITPAGVVTTLAGSPGSSGSTDGAGADARFRSPYGVAVDGAGNVLVADSHNRAIRKITPEGLVNTLVGAASSSGYANDGGIASPFGLPADLAVDGAGNVFVTDQDRGTVDKITPAGVVTTLAGSLGAPFGVAVDGAGNVLVADLGNHVVLKITPAGEVSTIVGVASTTDVGTLPGPLPASLAGPCDVAVNPSNGSLYITVPSAVMVASW
jgi:sugar lactone lactonase YvrE